MESSDTMNMLFHWSLVLRSPSHRQRAEIQLEGLLNEPEEFLPTFARRASSNIAQEEISVEDASKLLNTQPFIIERLIQALYSMSTETDVDITKLDRGEIQRLTRILNSTFDVRALLFFMILDENGDHHVTREELAQFYEKYLTHLKTFDNERMQEVIPVLLQKFRLHQVRDPVILHCHLTATFIFSSEITHRLRRVLHACHEGFHLTGNLVAIHRASHLVHPVAGRRAREDCPATLLLEPLLATDHLRTTEE